LVGGAVLLLLIGAAFAVALLASGDGKGSGRPERAFGGYISPADQDAIAGVGIARNGANTAYVKIVQAANKGRLDAVARAAAAGRSSTETGLEEAGRIENEGLRKVLEPVLSTQNEVFVAYGSLASYAQAHRHGGSRAKVRELVAATRKAEGDARVASNAFYERISPYLTADQQRELQDEQRVWQSRLQGAGG
jgi:hypothetical protein